MSRTRRPNVVLSASTRVVLLSSTLFLAVYVSMYELRRAQGVASADGGVQAYEQQADASPSSRAKAQHDKGRMSMAESGLVTTAPEDPIFSQMPSKLNLNRILRVHVTRPDDWVAAQPGESGLYYYVMDGLREHPMVELVSDLDKAEVYLHLVLHTNITSYREFDGHVGNDFWKRVVVLDENDYFDNSFHRLFEDNLVLAYFKRSFVKKAESRLPPNTIDAETGRRDLPYSHWPMSHNYLPFSYGIARRYVTGFWSADDVMAWDDGTARDVSVVCTLRDYHVRAWPGARENVMSWLKDMNIEGSVLGEVSDWQTGNRHRTSEPYFDVMKRGKIVVTANPGDFEGDFRLWEAMCSKALIFVDAMYTPVPHFFVDGEDLIVYNSQDREGFEQKLRYYLDHPDEARRIAMKGFYKSMRHHRYVHRMDYVLSTVASMLDGSYYESGFYMKELAMRAQRHVYDKHGLTTWKYPEAQTIVRRPKSRQHSTQTAEPPVKHERTA